MSLSWSFILRGMAVLAIYASTFYSAHAQTQSNIKAQPINKTDIEQRIERLMQRKDMVGLAVAIIEGGEITYVKGFGETVAGSSDPVTHDTVFRWASVSKSIGATLTVDLTEKGYLGLRSPIVAFAPSLNVPDANYHTNVEHILSHSVGVTRNAFDWRLEKGEPPESIRTSLGSLSRICEPGECHAYQNIIYDSLTEAIERQYKRPFKSVARQKIFAPLGMDSASMTRDGLIQSKSWARPHNRYGDEIKRIKEAYYNVPAAAGVNSSILDLARWVQAQIYTNAQNPRSDALSEKVIKKVHTPRISTPGESAVMGQNFPALSNARYGLGWRVYDYDGRSVVGHRGAVEGYRASVLFNPNDGLGVAVLWNSPQSRPIGLPLEIFDQAYGRPAINWMRLGGA